MTGPALRLGFLRGCALVLACAIAFSLQIAVSQASEVTPRRLALVLANGDYVGAPLANAATDAGLIAAVLQDAGFEVAAARDLDLPALQQSAQEFINRLEASGPNTVAFVYLSGYGAQILGENYLLPAAAPILTAEDVQTHGLLLSQFLRAFAAVPARERIAVLDLARANAMPAVANLTPGLALPEVPPGMLLAMNTAPGTLAEREPGPYGAYVLALGATLREINLPVDEAFVRTRLRASMQTAGSQTPWHASTLRESMPLFARAAGPESGVPEALATVRGRPISDLPEAEAYVATLDRDTLKAYVEFLAAYPRSPLAQRMAALLAARREALHWRHVVADDQPQAYWTYLQRYEKGAHLAEARARLLALKALVRPPSVFAALDDGLSPLLDAELPFVARGVALDVPDSFVPPPPVPAWLPLPPPWTPARSGENAAAFGLPLPEIAPVEGVAARPVAQGVALPAAVTAALATQRLTARKTLPPVKAETAPLPKPAPTVIVPVESVAGPEQNSDSLNHLANGTGGAVPGVAPPVVVVPAPVVVAPKPAPLVISPVETPPELPAPTLEAPAPVAPEAEVPLPAPVAIVPVEAPRPAPVPILPLDAPTLPQPAPAPVMITPVDVPVALPEPVLPAPQLPQTPPPVERPQLRPAPVPINPVEPVAPQPAAPNSPALVPMPPAPEDTGLPLPTVAAPAPAPLAPKPVPPVAIVPNDVPVLPPASPVKKPPITAPAKPVPTKNPPAAATPRKPAPHAVPARPAPARAAPPPRRAPPADAGPAPLDLRPPSAGKRRSPSCGQEGQPDCR